MSSDSALIEEKSALKDCVIVEMAEKRAVEEADHRKSDYMSLSSSQKEENNKNEENNKSSNSYSLKRWFLISSLLIIVGAIVFILYLVFAWPDFWMKFLANLSWAKNKIYFYFDVENQVGGKFGGKLSPFALTIDDSIYAGSDEFSNLIDACFSII